jgi:hypothetical protein
VGTLKTVQSSLGMVAQAYNPSYLGGRNWEEHGSVKSSEDPILMGAQWCVLVVPSYVGEAQLGESWSRLAQA